MEIFCFLLGILYGYTFNHYLPIASLILFYITPRYLLILLFFLGLFISWIHLYWVSPKGMPDSQIVPHALIHGSIVSIPVTSPYKTQFTLELEQVNNHKAYGLVQLSWYNNAPKLHAGERWRFSVKLKKPRNFQNPGSFNYVQALKARHIVWTGTIQSNNNQLIEAAPSAFSWLGLREQLSTSLNQLISNQQTSGVIQALALNLTNRISQDDWSLFRRTGTTHLFGVSGEHIALISGMIFWLIRWLWSRSHQLCLRIPAPYVASVCGLLVAVFYSLLAGFAPPVQRALIGCFFYTIYCLGKQCVTPWQSWRYALFVVLCLEPHAVFLQGFYFSFLAVACLLITHQRFQLKGYKKTLALQLSCLIGLMPLTLYWFAYGSLNGFIANLFAIPLVGFLIIPLTLLTLVVSKLKLASLLIKLLSWLVLLLFKGLIWTEQLAAININTSLNSLLTVVSLMGAFLLWILLPTKPFKQLALIWILISLFPHREQITFGEALIQVLDVGQGLAVSIRTKSHVLLYDTGDQIFHGSDFGKMVILPFYTSIGVKTIDKLIISHPDMDHRGGLKSVESGVFVKQLIVNNPKFYHRGFNCHQYPDWKWDGVRFHFFPININANDKNNSSCVLQISNAQGRVLLTGDIERLGEQYLIKTYGNQMHSEYLIVPHHASKTSSSYRFLLEIAPHYAIASLGFDNRFHFPHSKTLTTLNHLGIPLIRTDECGMVSIKLSAKEALEKPQCYKLRRRDY